MVAKFEKLFKKTLEKLGRDAEKFDVWLTFMSQKKMHELNFRTRGVDKPTDVLSFPVDVGENFTHLGDIIICRRMARRKKMPIDFLYVHGLLHLLGYDHETGEQEAIMTNLAEEILK